MRALVLVVVLLGLSWAMPAHAITPQEAMQACADYDANVYSTGTVSCMDMGNNTPGTLCSGGGPAAAGVGYVCGLRSGGGSVNWQYSFDFSSCVAPMEYDKSSHQCADLGERCRAKNSIVPDTSTFAGAFGTCVDGCMIGEREPNSTGNVQVDQQSTKINFGKIGFTGETCTGSVELPNFDTGKTCVPSSSGMTVCVTPDGRHCYSTKTTVATLASDAVCWQPGETGSKSKGPVTQTRGPGTNPPTPPPPPDGESHTPGPGNPTTTTTQKPGTPTPVTTTTTNVTNINGTDGPNQQEGDGSGEDDGEGNGLSGGGDCATPPIPTGDVVMGFIAAKIWSVACEGEGLAGEAAGMDQGDGSAGTEGNSLWGTDDTTTVVLDEVGLGFGQACPDPPQILDGVPLDWSALCTVMGFIGLLILAAAHLHAFFIIAGD